MANPDFLILVMYAVPYFEESMLLSHPLAKLKGADSSTLPQSTSVLLQKVKRTNF